MFVMSYVFASRRDRNKAYHDRDDLVNIKQTFNISELEDKFGNNDQFCLTKGSSVAARETASMAIAVTAAP